MSLVKIEDLYASAHMQYGQSPRFTHLSAFHFESFDFFTLYVTVIYHEEKLFKKLDSGSI